MLPDGLISVSRGEPGLRSHVDGLQCLNIIMISIDKLISNHLITNFNFKSLNSCQIKYLFRFVVTNPVLT